MRYTKEQLYDWLDRLDLIRQKLEDELLWLRIEEYIRANIINDKDNSIQNSDYPNGEEMIRRPLRLLGIYDELNKGHVMMKEELANRYGVDEKKIQEDLDDISAYLSGDNNESRELVYDR